MCLRVKNPVGEAVQCFAILVEHVAAAADAGAPLIDAGALLVDAGAPLVDAGALLVDAGMAMLKLPHFVSSPSTSAYCGVPYRYSGIRVPQVEGSGPFEFSVAAIEGASLPAGLSVDATTGELSWTPRQTDKGATALRLTATNGSGRDEQVFSIQVECPDAVPRAVGCSCGASDTQAVWLGLALLIARRRSVLSQKRRSGVQV